MHVQCPSDLNWVNDPLPDADSVNGDARILVWIELNNKLNDIRMIMPHQRLFDFLRWCDMSRYPLERGLGEIKYWAWLKK